MEESFKKDPCTKQCQYYSSKLKRYVFNDFKVEMWETYRLTVFRF